MIVIATIFVNSVLVFHFKRHLMVWSVFVPRFLYSCVWSFLVLFFAAFVPIFVKNDEKKRIKKGE